MVEKFSDYEGTQFIDKEGDFKFEVTGYELKDSKNGNPMAVLTVKSDEGSTTLYHSLNPKARWSYNNLIKCCFNLNTKEKIEAFECDYETIGQQLIGKTFIGHVECQTYEKEIKTMLDDGTFETGYETKESYKITKYDFVK